MARPEARLILPALGLAAAGLAYRRLTTGRATAVGILVLAVAAAHVHEYRRADVSFHAVEAALVRSLPAGTPVLSLLPTVNLPTASQEKGLGSGSPDYTVALLTGADLGADEYDGPALL